MIPSGRRCYGAGVARATILLLLASLLGSVACDTASENEGCVDPNDRSKPGSDPSQCRRSTFSAQDFRARDVSGIVRRGEDPVVGASVRVAPSPHSSTLRDAPPVDTNTDVAGFFRVAGGVPALYDLTFKLPNGVNRRDDLLVYRDVAARYLEPQLEVPGRTLARSWIGRVDPRFDTPVAEGLAILFLASGEGIAGSTGDLASGLSVHMASFTRKATIHAIAYTPALGLNSATGYGSADVTSDAGATKVVNLHLDPITAERPTPTFELDAPPPGFVPGNIDVRIGVGRTSDALLVSIPWGTRVSLAPIPNQGFTYQVRATRADGAIADSGETGFDIGGLSKVKLVPPPEVIGPEAGATIGAGDLLLAGGPGIIEHVFEPTVPNGDTLDIVMRMGPETPLPDAKAVGVTALTGTYTWTVRSYPNLTFVEQVWGADGRRFRPFAISAPRTVVLR